MSEYDLPVSPGHRKALEARKKMNEARLKHPVPKKPAFFSAGIQPECQGLFDIAYGLYGEAFDSYVAGDTTAGMFYQAWAEDYMHRAMLCESLDHHPF
jgi:hypothetical protein